MRARPETERTYVQLAVFIFMRLVSPSHLGVVSMTVPNCQMPLGV